MEPIHPAVVPPQTLTSTPVLKPLDLRIGGIDNQVLQENLDILVEHGDIWAVHQLREDIYQLVGREKTQWTSPEWEAARRADRAIGVLVRRGQVGPDKFIRSQRDGDRGKTRHFLSPDVFFKGSQAKFECCYLGEATEEEFAAALKFGYESHSLGRERLVSYIRKQIRHEVIERRPRNAARTERKVKRDKGEKSVDPSKRLAPSKRHELLNKTRRIDVQRVVDNTISTLEGVSMGLAVLDKEDIKKLSPQEAHRIYNLMGTYIGDLRRFRNGLKQGEASRD